MSADANDKNRRIQSYRQMKEMLAIYYLEAKNAEHNNKPVAWITSGAPVEFLLAMDVIPIYPENHAAMCGIQRMAPVLLEDSEARGYSRDLCSYARTDFGQMHTGNSPIMGLPKPDFVLAANNICTTVIKWYEVVARYYDVPLFVIDLPFLQHGDPDDAMLAYVRSQFFELVAFMEDLYKRKMDWDRLKQTFLQSAEAVTLWGEVLNACAHVPAPMSCFDAFILMGPIVTLRGDPRAIDFYKVLVPELKERIAAGVSAVEGETYRLLWDNLPIWFAMKPLSLKFADLKTCLVAATYTSSWAATFDVDALIEWDDVFTEVAKSYLQPYINSSFDRRVALFTEMVRTYKADGFVMHSDRSCKPYSIGQYQLRDRIQKAAGVPGLIIEADMNDPRVYAEGPTYNRIEAFVESLEVRH